MKVKIIKNVGSRKWGLMGGKCGLVFFFSTSTYKPLHSFDVFY